MNKVILSGRLTKDPDVRTANDDAGTLSARYTLAVDRRRRQGEQTAADFISCVVFRQSAVFAEKYLKKGMKILVTGRIQTGSYTSRTTGQKVYTTEVIVEEQEFGEPKRETDSADNSSSMRDLASEIPSEEQYGYTPEGKDRDPQASRQLSEDSEECAAYPQYMDGSMDLLPWQ